MATSGATTRMVEHTARDVTALLMSARLHSRELNMFFSLCSLALKNSF
jgi:hypothetical protein